MKGYATKLIEITEHNADKIALQWLKDVRVNRTIPRPRPITTSPTRRPCRTPSQFYTNFRALFCTDKPFDAARKFFTKYADERYSEGIPAARGSLRPHPDAEAHLALCGVSGDIRHGRGASSGRREPDANHSHVRLRHLRDHAAIRGTDEAGDGGAHPPDSKTGAFRQRIVLRRAREVGATASGRSPIENDNEGEERGTSWHSHIHQRKRRRCAFSGQSAGDPPCPSRRRRRQGPHRSGRTPRRACRARHRPDSHAGALQGFVGSGHGAAILCARRERSCSGGSSTCSAKTSTTSPR